MSKIVIDARQYTTSTGRYVYRLVQYLEKVDTQNDYVILLKPEDMDIYPFTNPHFTKLSSPYKEFTFAEQFGFAHQLYSLKADLVHFGLTNQPVLYGGRSVTTVHDLTTIRFVNPDKNPLVFKLKQQVLKAVIWFAAHKSKAVFTPTQFVKNDLVKFAHIPAAKVIVTYESADAIADKPQAVSELTGKRFIMYVGRPTPHKNLDRLIAAFVLLQKQQPDLYMVLVGKQDRNYEAHAQRVKNEQIANIIFTGFSVEGELRWLYEHCAAYVFPSLSEGFGLPPIEAMYHGAPIVSSNATCLPEVIGAAAEYFDPLNVENMASTINKVLSDEQLRQTLTTAGYAQAAKYSWQRMAEQTLAVYQQVMH